MTQTLTTEAQIESVRNLCKLLPANVVKAAWVNDWGRFGNFDIFVVPAVHTRHSTVQIKTAVSRLLPSGAKLRAIYGPDPIREWKPWVGVRGKMVTVGYRRGYWSIDIDFQTFHEGMNRFDSQLKGVKVDGYPVGHQVAA